MRRVTVLALMVLVLFAAGLASGQECQQGTQAFGVELDAFIADLYAVSDLATQFDYPAAEDLRGSVVMFDEEAANATEDELVELCALFERSPSVIESPQWLIDIMDASVNGGESGQCRDSQSRRSDMDYGLAIDLANSAAAAACDTAGCWDGVAKVVCAYLCALAGVMDAVVKYLDYEVAVAEDDCFNVHSELLEQVDGVLATVGADVASSRNVVTDNLDAAVSSRATQASVSQLDADLTALSGKLGQLEPDLTGELGDIAADLSDQEMDRQAYRELSIRYRIERTLQPGQTGRISLFQLPQSVGGRLEQVREVVATTITTNLDAGQPINDAFLYFNLADALFNSSHYKAAFTNYRLAYQEAVRPPDLGPSEGGGQ